MASMTEVIWNVLRDGKAHSNWELAGYYPGRRTGKNEVSLARLASRVFDAKKKYGVLIPPAKKDENFPTKYWYQISGCSKCGKRFSPSHRCK